MDARHRHTRYTPKRKGLPLHGYRTLSRPTFCAHRSTQHSRADVCRANQLTQRALLKLPAIHPINLLARGAGSCDLRGLGGMLVLSFPPTKSARAYSQSHSGESHFGERDSPETAETKPTPKPYSCTECHWYSTTGRVRMDLTTKENLASREVLHANISAIKSLSRTVPVCVSDFHPRTAAPAQ